MRTNTLLLFALLTIATTAFEGCGDEPIPDNVSYAHDIKPLMEARCIRCHGAGGMLNMDPSIPAAFKLGKQATNGDFTRLDSHLDGTGKMINGLMAYTGPTGSISLKNFVDTIRMPPPPAPKLTQREHDMLFQWAANPLP